ncbi:uncharacterized protein LOC115965893 [Quercus lobata]|uniref:uncharacterized protein LOC115965893 n=1 Tax=Quercus lobata TaxID=97700 RepID=UPI00124855E5|nr:uncharacterized protein LOC115965893 [Quercus lobata]
MEEVEKLLTMGCIQEVYYPKWLINVIMVKKSNGKWKMCMDFIDLNKACPKDNFPLPRIDQLIDSTAGHELLTFMDAFSSLKGIGVIVTSLEKDVLKYGVQLQFPVTNNEAEYEVILTNLRIAKALGVKNLKLKTNSKLVIGQITNKYEALEERMKRYLKLINQLVDYFDDVKFEQIPWETNLAIGEAAKLASSEDALKKHRLYMEIQTIPSIERLQAFPFQQSCT